MIALAMGLLLTQTLVAAPDTAVLDLSDPKDPSLARALRKSPPAPGPVLSAARTDAVTKDSAAMGFVCDHANDSCLQRLEVFFGVDDLLVFAADDEGVDVARVRDGAVARARVPRQKSDAATARAVWDARVRVRKRPALPANDDAVDDAAPATPPVEPVKPVKPKDPEPTRGADAPALDDDAAGGFPVPLAVGVAGLGVGAALGTGALLVSAELARQLQAARADGVPLGDNYAALDASFWGLTAAAAAAAAVGVGGFTWHVVAGE